MNFALRLKQRFTSLAGSWLGQRNLSGKLLGLILFSGFCVRLYICFFASVPVMHRDTIEYFDQADAIIVGGYTNFFPNGFPFIVAFFKTVFGENAVTALLWLSIFFSTLSIYFVFHISRSIFISSSISLIAAFLLAFYPSQINYVRWLTTEIPTTFFLTGAYFFYYRRSLWVSGLFFGIAVVIRTEISSILILLLAGHLLFNRKISINLIIGASIPIILVGYYCYVKTGEFSLAGHGRVNIIISTTASGGFIDWGLVDKYPEVNTNSKAVQMYMNGIKEAPLSYIQRRVANFWELWGFYPSSAEGSRSPATRLTIGMGNFFLLVCGLLGFWRNRKDRNVILLIIPFVTITLLHIAFFAMQRYTIPVEPFLLVLSAWAIYELFLSGKKE